jgi:quercetin dioxygenase-like cupin family protein
VSNLVQFTFWTGKFKKIRMIETKIPYQTIDWTIIPTTEHKGEAGSAYWQTIQFPGLRIRIVEYSMGYIADHWCHKGHIVHCLEGEFVSELQNGEKSIMAKGNTYVVSDEMSSHRSIAKNGAKLMIIDGDFLK